MSLMSISGSSEAEGVSSLSLMPQIQEIMAQSLRQRVPLVPTFPYHMEHSRANAMYSG